MAKIPVCDVCLTRYDKLTKAPTYLCVKGHENLRLDLCRVHSFEVKKKFPGVASVEYVQFVYEMVHGRKLTHEGAQRILRKGG